MQTEEKTETVEEQELRKELESKGVQVWNTPQARDAFEFVSFLAPTVTVIRKSDRKRGFLFFTDRPRFYYGFTEENA